MNKRLVKIIEGADTIVYHIFKILLEVGEFTVDRCVDMLTTPYSGRGRWRSVYMSCYRLEKKGYLEKQVKNGQVTFRLTEPTKKELVAIEKLKLKNSSPQKWDGVWRLVPFDIPEVKKKHRDILRYRLKRLGLERYQQSIWLTPYPLSDDFYQVIDDIGLNNCVEIIETKFMPRQEFWLKKFGLR